MTSTIRPMAGGAYHGVWWDEAQKIPNPYGGRDDPVLQRMDREDWHGVMDASADIREIDAKLAVLAPKGRK